MTREDISNLLGRPLTPFEDSNFDLYLDIAEVSVEDLLCTSLEPVNETRKFYTRNGYSTAFVDIFWNIDEVKINDKVMTNFNPMQWDKFNGEWYNSLVFSNKFKKKQIIEVTADWGFPPSSDTSNLPVDLERLIAGLFAQITKVNKFDSTVESKDVEDFKIVFNVDTDLDEAFYNSYRSTINKYSLCDIPDVQHGEIRCRC